MVWHDIDLYIGRLIISCTARSSFSKSTNLMYHAQLTKDSHNIYSLETWQHVPNDIDWQICGNPSLELCAICQPLRRTVIIPFESHVNWKLWLWCWWQPCLQGGESMYYANTLTARHCWTSFVSQAVEKAVRPTLSSKCGFAWRIILDLFIPPSPRGLERSYQQDGWPKADVHTGRANAQGNPCRHLESLRDAGNDRRQASRPYASCWKTDLVQDAPRKWSSVCSSEYYCNIVFHLLTMFLS